MISPDSIPFRYEFMSLQKLRQILNTCPVAIVPTGSLEWHGEHNSLGLDGHSATYAAEKALIMLENGVLLPTNYLGTYGWPRYPGCLVFDQPTVTRIFYEYFRELIKIGFRVIVILTGHWGPYQTKALQDAARDAQAEAKGMGIDVRCLGWRLVDIFPDPRYGHAQTLETSIEMAVARYLKLPLVDLTKIRTEDQNMGKEMYNSYNPNSPNCEPPIFAWDSAMNISEKVSADIGDEYINKVAKGLALEILEYLDELKIGYTPTNVIQIE
jgi:creatinine amidohydrolase/Fe(II)-dependent formamide hydrolase-like protein